MKIDVLEYEKKYSFELEPVTQLCGQNIKKKTYILESIRRYFSTYKYLEGTNKWRDNIKVDGKIVGRKFFSVLSVSNISDVLALITWSKQSLMVEYVKQLMQKYDWQMHLRTLNEEIEKMVQMLNKDMSRLGNIELSYDVADIWNMVQKTDIAGVDQMLLEEENFEVINILLNLLEEVMAVNPRKMIVLFENIDHLITKKEYKNLINKIENIAWKNNLYFILTTSIEGYCECDDELCSGISIFGDVDFQMPEYEKLVCFINDNYPYYKNVGEDQVRRVMERIIHSIGQQEIIHSWEELVICKMINQTLLVKEKWEESISEPEMAFLKS